MTEQEWLECADLPTMLETLQGKASQRKMRLFAVACCRQIWHLLKDERFRQAVEIAENFADGLATAKECEEASKTASALAGEWAMGPGLLRLDGSARFAGLASAWVGRPGEEADTAGVARRAEVEDAQEKEMANPKLADWAMDVVVRGDGWRSEYVRDLFGNPFRPVRIDPSWLTPNVVTLAQAIYDDRAFDRMPELADALQEAGCDNDEMLSHCRGPGPHVRGCWVVDLVLGKE